MRTPDFHKIVPVRRHERDAAEHAREEFLPPGPVCVRDDGSEGDYREPDRTNSRNPVSLVVSESEAESEKARRHDSPKHPFVEVCIRPHADKSNRQYGGKQRHCQTVQYADSRQCDCDSVEVTRDTHGQHDSIEQLSPPWAGEHNVVSDILQPERHAVSSLRRTTLQFFGIRY